MPLCPASRPRQVASVPTASGDTSPTPVTTTRRRTAELKISTGGEREAGSRGSVLVPGIQLNVLDRLLDVADLLGFFVRDLDPELLLEGHDQLHDVAGVGAKVGGEVRRQDRVGARQRVGRARSAPPVALRSSLYGYGSLRRPGLRSGLAAGGRSG